MLLILIFYICIIAFVQAQTRVETKQGWVIGKDHGDHLAFYGIPYAGDTSGVNRFKPPTAVPKRIGDFQAVNSDVICAQPTKTGTLIGIEDCLVLNIHTQNLTSKNPVFVWLEGEDYQTSTKAPHSYIRNLVVVTMNYRLSIFGFLCLGVKEAPGNAGLKDVIQGLQWIRDNIAGFGGDPNNVMLVGHGSAAAMVDLITLSPLSNNLVHKAVVLSGSALAPWAVSYNPIESAQYIGAKLEYRYKSRSELAKLLANTKLNAFNDILTDSTFYNASLLFAPCIEDTNLNPGETLLTDAPINILQSGSYNHIPYLTGYTNREGTLRITQTENDEWIEEMENNFSEFLPVSLSFYNKETKMVISDIIRKQYFGDDKITKENLDKILEYHGDVLVTVPINKGAEERDATSKGNVRLFEFAYEGTLNSDWNYTVNSSQINGSRHGDIPKYIFDYDLKQNDANAKTAITNLLRAFATGESMRVTHGRKEWLPMDNKAINKLYISSTKAENNTMIYSESITKENEGALLFWDGLLLNYYKAPIRPPPEDHKKSAPSLANLNITPSMLIIIMSYLTV